MTEQRFEGRIAGLGSTSGGTRGGRLVLEAPRWGEFADVMVEDPAGHRLLLAPDRRMAQLVTTIRDSR